MNRKHLLTLTAIAAISLSGTTTWAASVSFNDAGSTGTLNWADAVNWSTNPLLPAAIDDATFKNSGGAYTINLGVDRTVNSILSGHTIGGGNTTFGTGAVNAQTLIITSGLIQVPQTIPNGGNLIFNSRVAIPTGTAARIDIRTGTNGRAVQLVGNLDSGATTTLSVGDYFGPHNSNKTILRFGSNNRATFLGTWFNYAGLVRYDAAGSMGDGQITFGVLDNQISDINRNMNISATDTLINPFVFAPNATTPSKKPNVFFGIGTGSARTLTFDNAWTGTADQIWFGNGTADINTIFAVENKTYVLTNSAKVNTFIATGGVFIHDSTFKVNKTSAFGNAANVVTLQTIDAAAPNSGAVPKLYWTTADAAVPYNFTVGRNFGLTGNIQFGSETGSVTYTGQVNLSLSDLTVVTKNTADTLTFDGAIIGSNDLVIDQLAGGTGAGKVIFGTTNKAYTGTTTVNFGTLAVNVTLASSGVTVAGGATLQGTGNITNGVTITGNLNPGNSIGTLTVGSANFISGGTLNIELGTGTSSDLLAVTGNLDITNAVLALTGTGSGSNYIIATYGSLTGLNFASITGLPDGYSIDYGTGTNSQISLLIPEPATLALLTMGGLMMVSFRGRGCRRTV